MSRRKLMAMTAVLASWLGTCGARAEPCPATAPSEPEVVAEPPVRVPSIRVPAVADVIGAAFAAAGLDGDPTRSWVRRARLSGLVPWLAVRTGRNTRWQSMDPEIDQGVALEVRATWRLDRLMFDGRELQVASIAAARRRERRQLASLVVRLYFAWRRAVERDEPTSRDEAAAELDALTDGWFSEAVARRLETRRVATHPPHPRR